MRENNQFSEEESLVSLNLSTLSNSEENSIQEESERENQPNQMNTELKDELLGKLVKFINEKYVRKIREMCASNGESIEFDFKDLMPFEEELETKPELFLENFESALTTVTARYFPGYFLIRPKIHPRIVGLPVIESLRALRNCHLNKLIRINGVVTRRSSVYSLYSEVMYSCGSCKASFGPFVCLKELQYPKKCFECQKSGPFTINASETIYRDFQKITVQEIPNTVPSGSLPRAKEALLFYDLIDSCKPGDEIDVVGIYKNNFSLSLNVKSGFPVFSTVIECCSLKRKITKLEMTEEDVQEIRRLAKDPEITDRLIKSIAPSIYGHNDIKTAILLSMVGGCAKEREGMRIRGDINVLLLGDPGTAKSQFLRFVHRTSHRGVMATGQGASGVGLTASVRRDPMLKEWVLEGGALVLADNGVCCIDEFDKMNENDRTSIHEAMEQQSISISKAGIVASLHARCSVIAAANPIRSRYNPSLSFSQNVNLSDPIVSRFDILCVVKDVIDEGSDRKMAEFILKNHASFSNKENDENLISDQNLANNNNNEIDINSVDEETLKKYIIFARNNFNPKMSDVDSKKISQLYIDLRRESMHSGIPITVRHIESIVRISEAFAKLRLSNWVERLDIERAISVTLSSFLSAQKYSVSKQLKKKFSKYFDENNDDLLLYVLKKMVSEKLQATGNEKVKISDFKSRCRQNEIKINEKFIGGIKFNLEGFCVSNEFIIKRKV